MNLEPMRASIDRLLRDRRNTPKVESLFRQEQAAAAKVDRRAYQPREQGGMFIARADSSVYKRDEKTGAIRRIGVAITDGKHTLLRPAEQTARGKKARKAAKRARQQARQEAHRAGL